MGVALIDYSFKIPVSINRNIVFRYADFILCVRIKNEISLVGLLLTLTSVIKVMVVNY